MGGNAPHAAKHMRIHAGEATNRRGRWTAHQARNRSSIAWRSATRARRPSLLALAAGLLTLAGSFLKATPVQAGTYVIRHCNVPGHASAPITPWKATLVPNVAMFNTCSSGGGFGLAVSGPASMAVDTAATLELTAPEATALRRIRLWYSTRLTNTSTGSFLHSKVLGMTVDGHITSDESYSPGISRLDTPLDVSPKDEVRSVKLIFQCRRNLLEPPHHDCVSGSAKPIDVRGVELTIEESIEPVSTVTGGSLFATGSVSSTRTLDYAVADNQSGVKAIEIVIGNTVVASKDLSGNCHYFDPKPCPGADAGSLAIDTRKVPDGIQPVILRTTDAAGNRASLHVQLISVQNASSASTGSPARDAQPAVKVTANLVGTKRSTMAVPFGRRVTIRGRVSTASKTGIGGALLDVMQRTRAKERRVGTVKTKPNGTYTYGRTIRGPTRTLRFVYRTQSGARRASRKLTLRVRASASLRVSLRGRTVRFRGRVLSRPLPKSGKKIRLQGRTPGFKWATFAQKRTDRRGRFAGSYRLSVRRPGVRLQIRVWIPSEKGFRYLSYRGTKRTLRVR